MGKYIDKFRSLVGKKQTDQILKLLQKKKSSGQIRGVEEFTKELNALLDELTGTVISPSLKLFLGEPTSRIDSERFNFMLDRVEDDLDTAFVEANNIAEVQSSHVAIIRDMVLKNLKAGLDELGAKVSLYEFLNQDTHGFHSAIFSTFKESKEGRTGRQVDVEDLFVDPRTGEAISATHDAYVDLYGERLVLPLETNIPCSIRSVRRIYDSEAQAGHLDDVDRPGTSLEKAIDGLSGTYWVTSTIFPTQPEYVKVKLELDLGSTKEINYLQLEPVHIHDVYIDSLLYEDVTGSLVSLGVSDVPLSGVTSVMFRQVAVRKLVLVLRNENPVPLQFQYNMIKGANHFLNYIAHPQAYDNNPSLLNQFALSSLSETISSPQIQENVTNMGFSYGSMKATYRGFEFITGIDNIRVGLAKYRSYGVFVSSPLVGKTIGQVGIKAVERRPYTDIHGDIVYAESPFSSDSTPFWGSVEYWVVKRDFSSQGILIRSSTFPLLPLGQARVYHERLVLNERSASGQNFNDTGSTMFFTTYSDGNIKVYQNGTEVPNIDSEPGAGLGWSTDQQVDLDKTPNSGDPMVFKIRVTGGGEGDIFTVSYNPVTSSNFAKPLAPYSTFSTVGGVKVVDLLGDLSARVGPENAVVLDQEYEQVSSSKLYLVVILRQNASDPSVSPALEEYTLLSSEKDLTKFEVD